ncbi:MAG: cation:proton antiporter [Fibromonadaceae bacterium]|jgi:CPA2 family monovalent cation:H+ antiporter-2|nr:cation:proton antiporter [Fibromonadaceae bacterium]
MQNYEIITLLALGFALAVFLGYVMRKIKLSPIVGYLAAGIVVRIAGPHVPGISLDPSFAHQLAEIGVIFLMFSVGLRFHLKNLLNVKRIAIPGAIIQGLVTTALGMLIAHKMGWSWGTGLILGISVSVSSMVVLTQVLTDNEILDTSQGHIAVGWASAILVLVLLPVIGVIIELPNAIDNIGGFEFFKTLCLALGKIAFFAFVVLFAGKRLIPWFLTLIARTRSQELFILSILALTFLITSCSAFIFEASFALGAFLAGMAIGQTNVGQEAAADALPMKEAFAVIFFVSVGMLLDPLHLQSNWALLLLLLTLVIVIKPLVTMFIIVLFGHSSSTALTVALALAQIGEFTFILSGAARKLDLMPAVAESVLVATAIFSIALNPLIFKIFPKLENALRSKPALWNLFNRRAVKEIEEIKQDINYDIHGDDESELAIIIGYGPVGHTVSKLLSKAGVNTVVIDMNVDTVAKINQGDGFAIFGDASKADILKVAGIERAKYLVVTPPDLNLRLPIIHAARNLNSKMIIYSRARYISEKNALENFGVKVCYEELEAAVVLAEAVLHNRGFSEEQILEEVENVRKELSK